MEPSDQTIGRLVERTEVLLKQQVRSDEAIENLTTVMGQTRETLAKLDASVTTLTAVAANYHELEQRMRGMEALQPEIEASAEFRKVIMKWGLIAALVAVAGGSTLGQVITHVLHILE